MIVLVAAGIILEVVSAIGVLICLVRDDPARMPWPIFGLIVGFLVVIAAGVAQWLGTVAG